MKMIRILFVLTACVALFIVTCSCKPEVPVTPGDNEEQVDPTPDPEPDPNPDPEPVPDPDPDPEPDPDPDPEPDPDPIPTEREVSIPEPVTAADGNTLRILAIGNSFSQDAVEQYLYELFKAENIEAIIGNMYIGGCTIDRHWGNTSNNKADYAYRKIVDGKKTEYNGKTLLFGIQDEKWDVITFQQASGSSGIYSTYSNLPALMNYVKENATADAPVFLFHQTLAYASTSTHDEFSKYDNNQITMYNAIVDAMQKMYNDNTAIKGVIPSGTAIQNARTSYIKDSFNRDGYHLEVNYGRFTAACTWFEALSGKDVTKNNYKPTTVNASQSSVAKTAAHFACQKPCEITELTDLQNAPTSDSLELPDALEDNAGEY